MDSKWLWILAGYLAAINLLGFFSMGVDKRKAKRRAWRTPEASLLLIAALGGALGSLLGMRAFRHKTKHKKFTLGIPALLILQIALAAWLCLRLAA